MKPTSDVRERRESKAGHEVTRREFLRKSVFGATACWTLPTFLGSTIFELDARAQSNPSGGATGPILIILQMGGGNDSLNTVIPYNNSIYINERPTLRINPGHGAFTIGHAPALSGLAQVNEAVALHPRLSQLRQIWLDGNLAIVNGVGYPNPNLSHFTSFDYYHTAKPNEFVTDGWLGRFFDHQCSGCEPQSAIHLNDEPTLAMRSLQGTIASVAASDPRYLSWHFPNGDKRARSLENFYRRAVGVDHPVDRGVTMGDEALAYVQRSAHAALLSARDIQATLANSAGFPHVAFPSTGLGTRMKDIAALIHGGSNTSIYYVEQGGYDTHGKQISSDANPTVGVHANLLGELDGALGAFVAEMKAQGNWNRVLLFTFSEFGRKVIQNGSLGTDHGAAESLFALGGQVNPGFYGLMPDLAQQARIKNHSLVHNIDFRRVYRTALEKWLNVPASAIPAIFPAQPANFSPLNFV